MFPIVKRFFMCNSCLALDEYILIIFQSPALIFAFIWIILTCKLSVKALYAKKKECKTHKQYHSLLDFSSSWCRHFLIASFSSSYLLPIRYTWHIECSYNLETHISAFIRAKLVSRVVSARRLDPCGLLKLAVMMHWGRKCPSTELGKFPQKNFLQHSASAWLLFLY